MRRERDATIARERAEAASKAGVIWKAAKPAPADHAYLQAKGIKPYGARLHGDALVIPMRDGGQIHSMQFIGPDGGKRFLTGGRVTGCYFSIGNPKGTAALCIAEGFATGATIHEATGYPVAVAFNAGNLGAVAKAMRAKFADLRLILCGDFDKSSTGQAAATDAARAVGGLVALPDFTPDELAGDRPPSDFNDLAALHGLEAVERAIANATAPARGEHQPGDDDAPAGEPAAETANPGASRDDDAEIIKRMAAMSPLEYDRNRRDIAKSIGVRPATLDKMVIAERKDDDSEGMGFPDIEPWTLPVDPGALLSEISATLRRFIICQQETADAVALWVAMTWFMDVVQVAPLAVITAPEKRCGKSQLLFLLGKLSYRPLTASNISPAALFRAVDAWKPTLLVDEADAFMRDNEELRGIINAGHTRDSAYVVRTVGDDFTPTRFSVWGAKALAGIGHLADTLMDRAIVLELRRKLPDENAERLRHAEPELFDTLAEKLARFADDFRDDVRRARPELPASLNDRAQDNWEPLLAIADIAGGEWATLGRKAALKLSGTDAPTMSTGTELLADIQEVFEIKKVDKISTAQLIEALCAEDERPWATYNRGKPITPRQVSKRLGEYGISSTTIRVGLETPKGFRRDMFDEAFSRYLVTLTLPSATTPQASSDAGLGVADHSPRCGNGTQSETRKPLRHKACGGVADTGGVSGEVIEVEV
jgi:putative DNA primase/helicase